MNRQRVSSSTSSRVPTWDELNNEATRIVKFIERVTQEPPCPKYLQDYLKVDCPNKVAVVFESKTSEKMQMTYSEVDTFAHQIEDKIKNKKVSSGFVGVLVSMNHAYPSVQLGVMRSGCATFNLSKERLTNALSNLRKSLPIKMLLLDEENFHKNIDCIMGLGSKDDTKHDLVIWNSENQCHILHIIELPDLVKEDTAVCLASNKPYSFAYGMMSSGTTGSQKIILVPHNSIIPNVNDFIHRVWKLNKDDVVFGASPPTFDPSMIELFCAIGCGGTILYVENVIKYDGKRLSSIFFKHGVTVLQITPSLFLKIGEELKKTDYFSENVSPLKVLAFGGEKCLKKEVLRYYLSKEMCSSLRKLINVYGLTEMSCWASFGIIDPYNADPICVGQSIRQTTIRVDHFFHPKHQTSNECHQILIESLTRVCVVLDQEGRILQGLNSNGKMETSVSIKTGDHGRLHDKLHLGIEFTYRVDSVVKISGVKLELDQITDMAMNTQLLKTAECVYFNDKLYLIVVPKTQEASALGLGNYIRANFLPMLDLDIAPEFYPSCIIGVHSIPVNKNGKLDMHGILRLAESQQYPWLGLYSISEAVIRKMVHPMWTFITGNRFWVTLDAVLNERFERMGGTSATAKWLVESIFSRLNLYGSPYHRDLEQYLFQQVMTERFKTVCHFIAKELSGNSLITNIGLITAEQVVCDEQKSGSEVTDVETLNWKWGNDGSGLILMSNYKTGNNQQQTEAQATCSISAPLLPIMLCEYDLEMCIDAKAVISASGISSGLVIIGSHSGYIIAVDTYELKRLLKIKYSNISSMAGVLWAVNLPGRIEADVTVNKMGDFVFIGSHKKCLYKLSVMDGRICAVFKTIGSIRAKAVLNQDDSIVVVTDDFNNLYCLRSRDLKLKWKKNMTGGMISTYSPALEAGVLMVTTVKTGLLGLSVETGDVVWPWEKVYNDCCTPPVVVKYDNKSAVICGSPSGVETLDIETGENVFHFQKDDFFNKVRFSPELHKCKFHKRMQQMVFSSTLGNIVKFHEEGVELNRLQMETPTVFPTILCTRKQDIRKNNLNSCENDDDVQCFLLSKPTSRDEFLLYPLQESNGEKQMTMRLPMTQSSVDNFSAPQTDGDILVFGGRDNKLHIIFCNSIESD